MVHPPVSVTNVTTYCHDAILCCASHARVTRVISMRADGLEQAFQAWLGWSDWRLVGPATRA